METYLIGWPDKTWSVLCSEAILDVSDIWDDVDATADPGLASVFRVRDAPFYVDLPMPYADVPQHASYGFPCVHWGSLEPVVLKAPWDKLWEESGMEDN
jgi:hypothetical protein